MMEARRMVMGVVTALAFAGANVQAVTTQYGDQDVLGTGTYASDPIAGATLEGLAPGATTFASLITPHGFPFDPAGGDFAGTDQIYVGSSQTAGLDGYSSHVGRFSGPQDILMDYSALVPAGHVIDTLTLGIAADDFQLPVFGQPYSALLNGGAATDLTNTLNSLVQTGPVVQFFTIGVSPAILDPGHVMALSIDEGGNGGDGWAVDFLTIGVTTSRIPVHVIPEPVTSTLSLLALGALGLAGRRRTAY